MHCVRCSAMWRRAVWYGAVWYGAVWYGAVWYGAMQCSAVWCGAMWIGAVWGGEEAGLEHYTGVSGGWRTMQVAAFPVFFLGAADQGPRTRVWHTKQLAGTWYRVL